MRKRRVPKSDAARRSAARRAHLYASTGGKCFYCGGQTVCDTIDLERDWLFPRPRDHEMAAEHRLPATRGGVRSPENLVPSCGRCNTEKGSFSDVEFRFVRGLRHGSLSFRFAFDPPSAAMRDWIIVHSAPFERDLIIHNMPSAAEAYRLRNGRTPRGPQFTS